IAAGHLPAPQTAFGGPVTEYYVQFPANMSICIDPSEGGGCSDQQFCAYHFSATYGTSPAIPFTYAVLPESTPPDNGCGTSTTNSGLGNLTSMTSHEMVESLTDPDVGFAIDQNSDAYLGWYDNTNGEIGDICNASQATIALGGVNWIFQKEWSNAQGACASSASKSPVVAAFSTTTGAPVSFDASGTSSPNGTISGYRWDFGDGSVASTAPKVSATPTVTHVYATPGTYTVSMIATDASHISGLAQHQITVNKLQVAATGSGSVTSSPAAINCPGACSANYLSSASVTLTPHPGTGMVFDHWSGDCGGSGACVVSMSAACNVTATFTSVSPPPPPPPPPPAS